MNKIKKAWGILTGKKEDPFEGLKGAPMISAALMRSILGSIPGVPKKEMSENERRQFEQTVAAFFPHVIEPTISRLIRAQEELMARGSEDLRGIGLVSPDDQIIFGRGTVNGLTLLIEEFKEAYDSHIAEVTKRGEKFDPRKLFPDLFEGDEQQ